MFSLIWIFDIEFEMIVFSMEFGIEFEKGFIKFDNVFWY